MINEDQIRERAGKLREKMGMSMTRFGEILGGYSEDARASRARARKFLSGIKNPKTKKVEKLDITIKHINNLSEHFGLEAEYFIK